MGGIGALKGGTLSDFFFHSVAKCQKRLKVHSVAKYRKRLKIEGGPFGEICLRKSHNAKKTEGDLLVSPGIVRYAEGRNNVFGSVLCAKWSTLTP